LNPQPHGYRKWLPLGYYFNFVIGASYYYFVLCSMYWFCPVSMVVGPTCHVQVNMVVKFKLKFKFKFNIKFKFKFKFLWIYSKFYLNLNSSSSLNSNFSAFYSNSNPMRGPQFCPIGFITNIAWIQTQIQIQIEIQTQVRV
jgi:hypothetical protein